VNILAFRGRSVNGFLSNFEAGAALAEFWQRQNWPNHWTSAQKEKA